VVHNRLPRLVRRLAARLVLPIALAGAASPAFGNDDTRLLRDLERVVFGSEFVGQDSMVLRKWVRPIRAAVHGAGSEAYLDTIERHLNDLRRITGHDISLVASADPARNAHVIFVDRGRFAAIVDEYVPAGKMSATKRTMACFGAFSTNDRQEITKFFVVIPNDLSARETNACVVEEITQSLGLPNDGSDIAPSIFNDDGEHLELTWRDELFLRVVYDPRVAAGMSLRTFAALAPDLIAELRQ
jgi:Protein of unknown function (DUF2927)